MKTLALIGGALLVTAAPASAQLLGGLGGTVSGALNDSARPRAWPRWARAALRPARLPALASRGSEPMRSATSLARPAARRQPPPSRLAVPAPARPMGPSDKPARRVAR